MVAGSITDGALAEPNWKVLRDDQGVFIPDAAALAVRAAALEEHPGLRQALGFSWASSPPRPSGSSTMKWNSSTGRFPQWRRSF